MTKKKTKKLSEVEKLKKTWYKKYHILTLKLKKFKSAGKAVRTARADADVAWTIWQDAERSEGENEHLA